MIFELRLNCVHNILLSFFLSRFCRVEDGISVTLGKDTQGLRVAGERCWRPVGDAPFTPAAAAGEGGSYRLLVFPGQTKEFANIPIKFWENVSRACCYVSVRCCKISVFLGIVSPWTLPCM